MFDVLGVDHNNNYIEVFLNQNYWIVLFIVPNKDAKFIVVSLFSPLSKVVDGVFYT